MNKKIIIAGVFVILMFLGSAYAQAKDLPDSDMHPDNSSYFAKGFFENDDTFFTFSNEAKAKRYLFLVEKKLLRVKELVERGEERALRRIKAEMYTD